MKLIKDKEGYYLCIEENGSNSREFIATTDGMYVDHILSKENCDEIFGVVDLEEIALSKASHFGGTYRNPEGFSDKQVGYLHGFIEGAELNKDKLFTVEDMRKVFNRGYDLPEYLEKDIMNEIFDDYIQLLQQPKEMEVEIVTEPMNIDEIREEGKGFLNANTNKLKLDENDCLILKKK
jgi:hypothetical protein